MLFRWPRGNGETMKLSYQGRIFVARCTFDERHMLRKAGFSWSDTLKVWYTDNVQTAATLRDYADTTAKMKIAERMITIDAEPSVVWTPPGLTFKPFQVDTIKWAAARNRSYIAAKPGLGKTIMAAAWITQTKGGPTVYICPPSLVANTVAELNKWTRKGPVLTYTEKLLPSGIHTMCTPVVIVVADSLIGRQKVKNDLLACLALNGRLIVDEAHRFKNDTSQRGKAVFGKDGLVRKARSVLFLSGTPLPNRLLELWPLLSTSAPETIKFMNKFQYGKRYCGAKYNGFGWEFKGSTNAPELFASIKKDFMRVIRKEDVLKDLPPKTREIVLLSKDAPAKLASLETSVLKNFSPEDLMEHLAPNGHLSTYRKELGRAKAPLAADFIRDALDDSDEAILVFTKHVEVFQYLEKALKDFQPLTIQGSTPKAVRSANVAEFQTNLLRRLFLGNIDAAGVGWTLTKATRVIMVEYSWVPAENEQAEDRAHRIGQLGNVHVQYLVFKNSLDRRVLETSLRKSKIIDKL